MVKSLRKVDFSHPAACWPLYMKQIIAPSCRGAPKGRTRGPWPSPCDLKSTKFSGFLPLNFVICVFVTRALKLFAI